MLKKLEEELLLKDKIVCVYAGKFGGLYLTNETFEFFKVAYDFWGNRFRILLLSSHTLKEITAYFKLVGIPTQILILKFVPHNQVAEYLGLADFAICPMKPLPSRRFSAPIKTGEYWAMGLPVLIPENISDDSEIIQKHNAGHVLLNFNNEEFINACKKIEILMNEPEIKKRIRGLALKYRNFEIAEEIYKTIYR